MRLNCSRILTHPNTMTSTEHQFQKMMREIETHIQSSSAVFRRRNILVYIRIKMNRVESAMKSVNVVITTCCRLGGSMKLGTAPGGGTIAGPSSKARSDGSTVVSFIVNCESYSRLKRTMTSRLSGTANLFSPFSRLDHVKRGAYLGREPRSETSNTAIILITWPSGRISLNQREASMKNSNGVRVLQHAALAGIFCTIC